MSKKKGENYEVRTTFGGKAPLTSEDIRVAEEKAAATPEVVFRRPETPAEEADREKQESRRFAQLNYGKLNPPG